MAKQKRANIIIQIIDSNKPRLEKISSDLSQYMKDAGYIENSQSIDLVPAISRYQATQSYRSKYFHVDPLASR
jgi:hypothetical protein